MAKINKIVAAEEYSGDVLNTPESQSTSATISKAYYNFENYVSKTRMLTFYHQIVEVLAVKPVDVLEVGVGSKLVAGALREFGVQLKTVDINASLEPDYEGSVLELSNILGKKSVDVVLCARVLHHLSFSEFETAIEQLSLTARKRVVLTLPRDELRIYLGFRRTAGQYNILSIKLPNLLKSILLKVFKTGESRYGKLWKIDSHKETSMSSIKMLLGKYFFIEKHYQVPEDQSHTFFILKPR